MSRGRIIGVGGLLVLLSLLLAWTDAVDSPVVVRLRTFVAGWRDGLGFLAGRLDDFLQERRELVAVESAELAAVFDAAPLLELRQENERLRELLGLRLRSPWRVVSAEFLPGSPPRIEAGVRDGLAAGMAVVDGGGLIGVLGRCGYTSSEILDFERSGPLGVTLVGCGQNGLLELREGALVVDYLAARPRPVVGELVVTSGLGSLPPGILVGQVRWVEHTPGGLELHCLLGAPRTPESLDIVHVIALEP